VSSLALILGLMVLGLVAIFVFPWVGIGILSAGVLAGIVILVSAARRPGERQPPEAPHLPGPGNPQSGVD
jgi:hypothetical protein